MNASVRWAQEFINALECVKCRTTQGLRLYYFNGEAVDAQHLTIEQLRGNIPRMDVWCDECRQKRTSKLVNTRVAGPGRLERKREAEIVANVRSKLSSDTNLDAYVLENGRMMTKQDLIAKLKAAPCSVCGMHYHPAAMEFYHTSGRKVASIRTMETSRHYTMRDLIKELEKCVLVCANCGSMLKHTGKKVEAQQIIHLDGNFFASV